MIVDPAMAPVSGANGVSTRHLSVAGGLTQFGAYVETLQPGAASAQRHWHEAEDEFLYVLDGSATVIDNDGAHALGPGDAAVWPFGVQNAHHVVNRGNQPCRYIIAGTRVDGDVCHYPDSGTRLINGKTRWSILGKAGIEREGDLPPELLNLPQRWGKPSPDQPKPQILRQGDVPADEGSAELAGYPALGPYTAYPISDVGGLSQFGAFTEILHPGSQSSHRHWHAEEDEFLYTLDGVVTLLDDSGARALSPGTCVCWPKGIANGHALRNETDSPVRYLVIGTRWPEDEVTYSDINLHYARRAGWRHVTLKDGTPLPGWPKETNR